MQICAHSKQKLAVACNRSVLVIMIYSAQAFRSFHFEAVCVRKTW